MFLYVLVGFGPAETQQVWKELTNGTTENKSTLRSNQNSSANSASSINVTGRQTGDQQPSCKAQR